MREFCGETSSCEESKNSPRMHNSSPCRPGPTGPTRSMPSVAICVGASTIALGDWSLWENTIAGFRHRCGGFVFSCRYYQRPETTYIAIAASLTSAGGAVWGGGERESESAAIAAPQFAIRIYQEKLRPFLAVPRIWIWIFDYPPDFGCEIRGKIRISQYLGSEKRIQLRFS